MARHKWSEIEARMTPERLAQVKVRAKAEMEQMLLSELRKQSGRTPAAVASEMGMNESDYIDLEASDDMPIGTLQRLARALGGELDILIHLPDKEISLRQFAETPERSLQQ